MKKATTKVEKSSKEGGKFLQKKKSAQRKKVKSSEESLNAINTLCEREKKRMDSLTTKHEKRRKELAVLIHIVGRERQVRAGQGRRKKIIESQDVRPFMKYACILFDKLQRRMHITLRYAWFCSWLCTRYDIRRQRGGGPGSMLSGRTVLSYFKRERAGG